jgi:hypothetical protein
MNTIKKNNPILGEFTPAVGTWVLQDKLFSEMHWRHAAAIVPTLDFLWCQIAGLVTYLSMPSPAQAGCGGSHTVGAVSCVSGVTGASETSNAFRQI